METRIHAIGRSGPRKAPSVSGERSDYVAYITYQYRGCPHWARNFGSVGEGPERRKRAFYRQARSGLYSCVRGRHPRVSLGRGNRTTHGAGFSLLHRWLTLYCRIIISARHYLANVRNGTRSNSERNRPAVVEQIRYPYWQHDKTVMTANDVNEQFPMMKYKYWVSVYAGGRLPTTASGPMPNSQPSRKDRIMPRRVKAAHSIKESPHSGPVGALAPGATITEHGNYEADLDGGLPESQWFRTGEGLQKVAVVRDEERQNEPILSTRTPSEPGGPCSICLEPLECEDYVRALGCCHVFHVACVDTWLISRRACCPVCKAEYHCCTHRRSAGNTDAAGNTNLDEQDDPFNLPRRLRAALLRGEGGSRQPSRQADP